MKIVTVVGARPQFIKAAAVSPMLGKAHTEVLVHTGQHYDYNMSEQFFEELNIPHPAHNLGVAGGTHAEMTGRMMIALEKVLLAEKPDALLVYGDTNSTLVGALTAAKLHIPVCHVEAGVRTKSMKNPEEINRICTDHISTLLMAGTEGCMMNLQKENLADRSVLVGDPMYDAFVRYRARAEEQHHTLTLLDGTQVEIPDTYYYLTSHREENTGRDEDLREILFAMEQLDARAVYPVHPRNKARAQRLVRENGYSNTILTEPVGYLTSLYLTDHALKIVTDSGGLQREAFFAGKKCVSVLDFVACEETMVGNRNQLARPIAADILEKLHTAQSIDPTYQPYGDGHAAEKITKAITDNIR